MPNFARRVDGVAIDVSTDPAECFTPELAAQFIPVPDGVAPGWIEAADGTWSAPPAPLAPPVDLAPIRAVLTAQVDAHRDALLSGGFTVPASVSAALGDQVLQTRNADDRVNWLTSETLYEKAVAAGSGATLGAKFRNAANATTTVSFTEGLAVLAAMATWGAAILDRSWTLKDAIAVAADQSALDAIDITGGWPA